LVPSSAIFQRPVIVFPSSLKVAVKHLGERLALPPELPLAVADGHLVDAADAGLGVLTRVYARLVPSCCSGPVDSQAGK
jgi:hypothetical protein